MTAQRDVFLTLEAELDRRIKTLEDDLARLTNRFWLQRGGDADASRIVWGSVLNDGGINNPGSSDWSSEEVAIGWDRIVITFDPVFTTIPVAVASLISDSSIDTSTGSAPNEPGEDPDVAYTGFLPVVVHELDRIEILQYDLDGHPGSSIPFDFIAVGGA